VKAWLVRLLRRGEITPSLRPNRDRLDRFPSCSICMVSAQGDKRANNKAATELPLLSPDAGAETATYARQSPPTLRGESMSTR
jgi:hypothetical protein